MTLPRFMRGEPKGETEWISSKFFSLSRGQAPMGCSTFSLPVPEVLERGGFERPELLAAVGSAGALVHDWKITLDLPSDRLLYQRTSRRCRHRAHRPDGANETSIADSAAIAAGHRPHSRRSESA